MCLSPRGIVAASVSALFALELEEAGQPVEALVPVTFIVIVVTVLFSAVASLVGAKRFRVARPAPRGVAFIGGPRLGRRARRLALRQRGPDPRRHHRPARGRPRRRPAACSPTRASSTPRTSRSPWTASAWPWSSPRPASRSSTRSGIDRAAETVGRANVFYLPRTETEDETAESAHAAVIARRPFGRNAHPGLHRAAHGSGRRDGRRVRRHLRPRTPRRRDPRS